MLRPTLVVRGETRRTTPARTLSVSVVVTTGGESTSSLYSKRSVREDVPAGTRMVKAPAAFVLTLTTAALLAPAYAGVASTFTRAAPIGTPPAAVRRPTTVSARP